jgi:hypothetical protein
LRIQSETAVAYLKFHANFVERHLGVVRGETARELGNGGGVAKCFRKQRETAVAYLKFQFKFCRGTSGGCKG